MDDDESTAVTDNYYDGMMHAYGNYKPDLGGGNGDGQTELPDTITPYPWSPDVGKTEGEELTLIIDSELHDMHPDYIQGSIKVLEGPTEGKGRPGWNEVVEGLAKIAEEIPVVDKIVKALRLVMPDIPESNYKCYLITADFNSQNSVENETFQFVIYENGKYETYRYGGDMVTEKR